MLTYANMNMKKTWQGYGARSQYYISAKQIFKNERFYFYLYPFVDLVQRTFQGDFYMCIK
jgi:hypothetical protein